MTQTIDDVSADIVLNKGRLDLEPLKFALPGSGNILSEIQIDGQKRPVESSIKAELSRIKLRPLLAGLEIAEKVNGTFGGRGRLSGTGITASQFLGSADGAISLIMSEGSMDRTLVEKMGLDIWEMLVAGQEETVDIHCGFTELIVRDGVMEVESLVIDTTDTTITGKGTINLDTHTLDLTLTPHPKDPGLVEVSAQLHIEGHFQDFTVSSAGVPLALQAGASFALEALTAPLKVLAPLVETEDETSACRTLVETTR